MGGLEEFNLEKKFDSKNSTQKIISNKESSNL
jgi:hypothetical protein